MSSQDKQIRYLEKCGFYEFKKIGEGAYGMVIRAKKTNTEKEYAIKLCQKKEDKSDPYKSKHYDVPYTSLREVCVLKSVNHPSLVK